MPITLGWILATRHTIVVSDTSTSEETTDRALTYSRVWSSTHCQEITAGTMRNDTSRSGALTSTSQVSRMRLTQIDSSGQEYDCYTISARYLPQMSPNSASLPARPWSDSACGTQLPPRAGPTSRPPCGVARFVRAAIRPRSPSQSPKFRRQWPCVITHTQDRPWR